MEKPPRRDCCPNRGGLSKTARQSMARQTGHDLPGQCSPAANPVSGTMGMQLSNDCLWSLMHVIIGSVSRKGILSTAPTAQIPYTPDSDSIETARRREESEDSMLRFMDFFACGALYRVLLHPDTSHRVAEAEPPAPIDPSRVALHRLGPAVPGNMYKDRNLLGPGRARVP